MRPVKAIVLPVTGDPQRLTIVSLKTMQDAVGGPIQRLVLKDAEMYVNEEPQDEPWFVINPRAILICALEAKHHYLGVDALRGTVLITGPTDRDGDITDVPSAWYEKLNMPPESHNGPNSA